MPDKPEYLKRLEAVAAEFRKFNDAFLAAFNAVEAARRERATALDAYMDELAVAVTAALTAARAADAEEAKVLA